MNVLFLSAVLPYPLYSGGQVRIYNLLSRLSKKHAITLISFIREDAERGYADKLAFCRKVVMVKRGYAWRPGYLLKSVTGPYPLLMATYDNPDMKRSVAGLLAGEKFDLIHLEPFYVWPSVPHTKVPLVVSEHNIEYEVYGKYAERFPVPFLRPFLSWDVGKMFRWERRVWREAHATTAVSGRDAHVMRSYLSHDVAVVPNGVDLSVFGFRPPSDTPRKRALFVGNFRWLPNRQAAAELVNKIWPKVTARISDAQLTVVGRHMPQELKRLCRKTVSVSVREDVEDIVSAYHDADVLIAPHAIAGGTKYKMLEAMAAGTPVVTTPQGMEGISAEPDLEYLAARTPSDFAAQTIKLWQDPLLRRELAIRGRSLIEREYTWDRIAGRLNGVWQNAASRKGLI